MRPTTIVVSGALVGLLLGGCAPALLKDPKTGQIVNCGSIIEKRFLLQGYIVKKECIEAYQKAGYVLLD